MNCKDCFHNDVCEKKHYHYANNKCRNDIDFVEKVCNFFKDKSKIVELPCKVGDTVYNIYWWKDVQKKCKGKDGKTYYRTERQHYVQKSTFDLFDYRNFGKTVFLTKEEAEARLKELQNNK